MDELLKMLKRKLDEMRRESKPVTTFDFNEVSQMYQIVCLMKQIKDIADWSDKGYA